MLFFHQLKIYITDLLLKGAEFSEKNFNLITLKFSRDVERRYRRDTFSGNRVMMSALLLVGAVMYALFAVLDYIILGSFSPTLIVIRFGIVIPIVLTIFFISLTPVFQKWNQTLLAISILIPSLGIVAMIVEVPSLGRGMYYTGLILVLFFNYILRLRFVLATVLGWSVFFCYFLSVLLFPHIEKEVIWSHLFFLSFFNLIGMLAAYSIEFFMRKNYLFSLELDKQRSKVEEVNTHLEELVKAKTVELRADIERRKLVELELIAAKEKAEESDRLKAAFLSNMSHEIRTPMNGILGFTSLLKNPKITGGQKEHYISIIEKSGDRMLNTINDIVDISRIEAGQVKVINEEVNINSMLEELYEFFYNESKEKGLKLKYETSLSDACVRIITDKHKLESVLINLIKNAIKFTDKGQISFGCIRHNDKLEFYVQDTGIGIAIDRQEAVFDRFVQADIEDERAFQGSGLGLSISNAYIKMLGGTIRLESEEGNGTIFSFAIPCQAIAREERETLENSDNMD